MNISAIDLSFDESMMWLELSDGRKLGVPLAYFPRLLRATPEQRLQYEMSGNGTGLHWQETRGHILYYEIHFSTILKHNITIQDVTPLCFA